MKDSAGRSRHAYLFLAALIFFQPALCIWQQGRAVAGVMVILDVPAFFLLLALAALILVVGAAGRVLSHDPLIQEEGRKLMKASAFLTGAGASLVVGAVLALWTGAEPIFGPPS